MKQRHRHQNTISTEIFSFPINPQDQDSDFEFGCLTSDSPTTDPYKHISPADHLFYNGKLLPHSFPPQQPSLPPTASISGSMSRTSSRKDSLMSSRSNSVNSSRSSVSCCSSGRTSSSENSERKLLYRSRKLGSVSSSSPMASKLVMAQLYGSSQRWQHIVPLPVLKREDSKRSVRDNSNCGVVAKNGKCKKELEEKKLSGFCLRFLKSLLVTCRECHSMEPSTSDDILRATLKL